tara:strand:- start:3663 stop:4433 length:771 start_codon:yes stop_codon:yes gene_type:complete
MIQFKSILEKLINDGVVGVKQSFEDEGVLFDDVVKVKRLCDSVGVYVSVKIGGCEAISDINNCLLLDVSGIVAPMVESEFALQKFVEAVINNIDIDKREKMNFYINVESKTAYENLDKILSSPSSKLLTGIVVGRSDLTKSFGYGKQDVVSDKMCKVVTDILTQSKNYGFKTLMGGNIGSSSIDFIKKLHKKKLLNNIETRNIIIDLEKVKINELGDLIKNSLFFESSWLNYKADYYNKIGNQYVNRSKTILDRIS